MEQSQILITVMIGLSILMATITILIFGIINFFKELKYTRLKLDNIIYEIKSTKIKLDTISYDINIILERDSREKIEQKERERKQNEYGRN